MFLQDVSIYCQYNQKLQKTKNIVFETNKVVLILSQIISTRREKPYRRMDLRERNTVSIYANKISLTSKNAKISNTKMSITVAPGISLKSPFRRAQ